MTFTIEFWGVRGSIAAPGPETARTGGNTSCVEVRCGETRLLLDAGTGIRALGERLVREGVRDINLLLSHLHWDHIQGLPFFTPLYSAATKVTVLGPPSGLALREVLARQMTAPVFPVRLDELASALEVREISARADVRVGAARIRVARANHPGGCNAYAIDYAGQSVVYATDTEHYDCVDPGLLELAREADVLIYDAQYTPEEYPTRLGWGHSTFEQAARLARAAGVGELILFHHDPRRTDPQVDEIEAHARQLFEHTSAAREGARIELGRQAQAA